MTPRRPLFPLPLTPFEHYMWADDRDEGPMVFMFRLVFRGHLDERRFGRALELALKSHPLLHARIQGHRASATAGLKWIAAGDQAPCVRWDNAAAPSPSLPHTFIDLSAQAGLRVYGRQQAQGTLLLLQFHHSCCDGFGALHFLETLFARYAHGECPAAGYGHDRLEASLRCRGRDSYPLWRRLRRTPKNFARVGRFFIAAPAGISSSVSLPPDGDMSSVASYTFSEEETQSLIAEARRRSVSVNDLMLRNLFVTLHRWNLVRGVRSSQPLRLAVPINMRATGEADGPARNCVSMVFLDRTPRQIEAPSTLLSGVRSELQDVRQWRMGDALLSVLRLLGSFPHGMTSVLDSRRNRISSTLSNMGILFDRSSLRGPTGRLCLEDAELETVQFVPPVRRFTGASFGVATYGGRLSVSVVADRSTMQGWHAQQLRDLFVREAQPPLAIETGRCAPVEGRCGRGGCTDAW
jgi:hypothetical protein